VARACGMHTNAALTPATTSPASARWRSTMEVGGALERGEYSTVTAAGSPRAKKPRSGAALRRGVRAGANIATCARCDSRKRAEQATARCGSCAAVACSIREDVRRSCNPARTPCSASGDAARIAHQARRGGADTARGAAEQWPNLRGTERHRHLSAIRGRRHDKTPPENDISVLTPRRAAQVICRPNPPRGGERSRLAL
jgi:hypothetical protein